MKHWDRWLTAVLPGIVLAALPTMLALGSLLKGDALAQGNTIYVDADASGANDGTSWEDAYAALQPALDDATDADEIWVAAGTYTPTYLSSPGDPRSATFQLENGVAVYGGFDPTVGDTGWEDRDWANNVTILSGDLDGDDVPPFGNNGENSYHVFYHPAELALDATAILDGFTVSGGNADAPEGHGGLGGGMFNYSSSPTLTNCTFAGNSTYSYGGGMENMNNSSPVVTNCTFSGNSAGWDGGGIYNYDASSPVVTNCTFSGNSAGWYAGGISNYDDASPVVTNSILWGDSPDEVSDYNSQPVVSYSDVQGGYDGTGNIEADPLFVDLGSGDYHLGPGSPCIDAGTNDAPSLPQFDFEGDPRVMDGNRDGAAIADMGVDEVYGYTLNWPLVLRNYP